MANHCSSCGKLCGLEAGEPEVELEIDGDDVAATVRIVCVSTCCSEEVKEAEFQLEDQLPLSKLKDHPQDSKDSDQDNPDNEHELEVEEDSAEMTERVEGRGRGARTFRGAKVSYSVRCSCQDKKAAPLHEGEFSDEIQASAMEDLS